MHLKTDALVEIAEGTRSEASAPHLAGCEACRAQVRALRATMSTLAEADVPEPSPLFWDHLSARVRDAVAREAGPQASRGPVGDVAAAFARLCASRAAQGGLLVAVGLLLAVVVGRHAPATTPLNVPAVSVADGDLTPDFPMDMPAGDASLRVVASLTDDVDLDTAREAGLASRGSADHAVAHLSAGELRELGRLLQEELARSGA